MLRILQRRLNWLSSTGTTCINTCATSWIACQHHRPAASNCSGRIARRRSLRPSARSRSVGKMTCPIANVAMAREMDVYFCDPSSQWQRGTNENTNGLLRQYFPMQTSLTSYGQAMLDSVAAKLNSRPRKSQGYKTPAQFSNEALH